MSPKTLTRFKAEIKIITENNTLNGILPIYDFYLSENRHEDFLVCYANCFEYRQTLEENE